MERYRRCAAFDSKKQETEALIHKDPLDLDNNTLETRMNEDQAQL